MKAVLSNRIYLSVNKEQTIWSFSSTSATTNEYKLYITADGNINNKNTPN